MHIARTLWMAALLGAVTSPATAVPLCGDDPRASAAPPALSWSGAEPDGPIRLTIAAAGSAAELQATGVLLSEPRSSLAIVGAGTAAVIALRHPRRKRARV